MKISAAFRDAFRVCFGHFGANLKFMAVELCMTLAAFTPLLFLFEDGLKYLALLCIPFYLLLMLWARVNAAAAMRDSLRGGSLFSYRLAEPGGYGAKLAYGLKRCFFLLLWAAPLIACLVIAEIHISGETDGLTVMRMIKAFGGGDLSTGIFYLILILAAAILIFAIGCAYHSGDRHAFVRNDPKLLKGHHGRLMGCWVCALVSVLPLLISLVVLVFRYLPALHDMKNIVAGTAELPSAKISAVILGVGIVLTIPLMPLRSMIIASYANGLEKE